MAAGNIDVTRGSAARVILDTKLIGAEDSSALAENIRRQVRARQMDSWNFENEGRAAKAEASQAKVAAAFGAASTIMGGASQYAKFKAGK